MSIPLISKIKPQNNGAFPIAEDVDIQGGYQVRVDVSDRNSIPALNRKEGMLVYVQGTDKYYTLSGGVSNSDWVEVTLGGGGGGTVIYDGEVSGTHLQLGVNSIHGKHFLENSFSKDIGYGLQIVQGAYPAKITYEYDATDEQYLYLYRPGNNDIVRFFRPSVSESTTIVLPKGFAAAKVTQGVTFAINAADMCFNKDNTSLYAVSNCEDLTNVNGSSYQSIAKINTSGEITKIISTGSPTLSTTDICTLSYDETNQRMFFFSTNISGSFSYLNNTDTLISVFLPDADPVYSGVVQDGYLFVATSNKLYTLDATTFSVVTSRTMASLSAGLPTSRLISTNDFVYFTIDNNVLRLQISTNTVVGGTVSAVGTAGLYQMVYNAGTDQVWIWGNNTKLAYINDATQVSPGFSVGDTIPGGFNTGITYLPASGALYVSTNRSNGEFLLQLNPSTSYAVYNTYSMSGTIDWVREDIYTKSSFGTSGERVLFQTEQFVAVTPNIPNFDVHLPGYPLTVGKWILIKDVSGTASTNNIRVAGTSATIEGAAYKDISDNYGFLEVTWNGSSWVITRSSSSTFATSGTPAITATTVSSAVTVLNKQNFSLLTIDLTGVSSDYTLSSTEYSFGKLEFIGANNVSFNVIFPTLAGRQWEVRNNMTGSGIMNAYNGGGNFPHLPKYGTTLIESDNAGTDLNYGPGCGGALEYIINQDVTGTGASPATFDRQIITLPTFFRLVRAEIRVKDSISGGTAQCQLGTSSGGNEILTIQSFTNPTDISGDLVTQLGADMIAGRGYEAFYPTATTVWFRLTIIAPSVISFGSVNIYLAGFRV